MADTDSLAGWTPRPLPSRELFSGRYVKLVPLHDERHTAELWRRVRGHDEVWDYLSDGPYGSEADLRRALTEKQNATAAVFLAIVPESSGEAEGYASYM